MVGSINFGELLILREVNSTLGSFLSGKAFFVVIKA
jgi:hypothetical protein